tara:strand:+ start:4565 stop:5977 length:1413 start_codon:yes stop_codon:yes gene_type:complete
MADLRFGSSFLSRVNPALENLTRIGAAPTEQQKAEEALYGTNVGTRNPLARSIGGLMSALGSPVDVRTSPERLAESTKNLDLSSVEDQQKYLLEQLRYVQDPKSKVLLATQLAKINEELSKKSTQEKTITEVASQLEELGFIPLADNLRNGLIPLSSAQSVITEAQKKEVLNQQEKGDQLTKNSENVAYLLASGVPSNVISSVLRIPDFESRSKAINKLVEDIPSKKITEINKKKNWENLFTTEILEKDGILQVYEQIGMDANANVVLTRIEDIISGKSEKQTIGNITQSLVYNSQTDSIINTRTGIGDNNQLLYYNTVSKQWEPVGNSVTVVDSKSATPNANEVKAATVAIGKDRNWYEALNLDERSTINQDLAAMAKVINNTTQIPEREKQNTVRQIVDFISNKFSNETAASGKGDQKFSRRTIVPATEILAAISEYSASINEELSNSSSSQDNLNIITRSFSDLKDN